MAGSGMSGRLETARIRAKVVARGSDAVRAGLAVLKAESTRRVPVDTGYLRDHTETRVKGVKGVLAYTADYAVYIHENLEIPHPQHRLHNCGGEAKFLKNALEAKREEILDAVKEKLQL